MNMTEAMKSVKRHTIEGIRGVGCATIHMEDGRTYTVVSQHRVLVERFSDDAELIERCKATQVNGEVESISWTCDESGAIYC